MDEINHIIGKPDLLINREYNGKGMQKLGIHRLVILTKEDQSKLWGAGYGIGLVRYENKFFFAFARTLLRDSFRASARSLTKGIMQHLRQVAKASGKRLFDAERESVKMTDCPLPMLAALSTCP